jgi:hypothetical protein
MKRIILSGIVAGALAMASIGAVGAAPLATQPAAEQAAARPGRGPLAAAAALIKATADATGLTQREVLAELKAGKSLAQIAQEHGKTADDILAKARELLQNRQQELLDRLRDLINQPGLRAPQNPAPTPAPTS